MPKKRKPENKGLPSRWTIQHGAYYYQVPCGLESLWDDKQFFRLGESLPMAYKTWAERLGKSDKANNIGQLLDKYACEVIPTKAKSSHARENRIIRKLKIVFGSMPIPSLRPSDLYRFYEQRKVKTKNSAGKNVGGISAAKHEINLLSHALTKAVEWGFINKHPFKGEVRVKGSSPRTRYIEDWEIIECLSLKSRRKKGSIESLKASIRLRLLTGLRKIDMLRLRESNIKEDGLHVYTSKTDRPVIYEWTDELIAAVDLAKASRPIHISPFLFCTKRGESYVDESTSETSGWDSMWQRFMTRVLSETKVAERFTEHDLRAKCASDAHSLEHARALLAHVDSRTTNRVYRRKPEKVRPKSMFE